MKGYYYAKMYSCEGKINWNITLCTFIYLFCNFCCLISVGYEFIL